MTPRLTKQFKWIRHNWNDANSIFSTLKRRMFSKRIHTYTYRNNTCNCCCCMCITCNSLYLCKYMHCDRWCSSNHWKCSNVELECPSTICKQLKPNVKLNTSRICLYEISNVISLFERNLSVNAMMMMILSAH